VPVARSWREHLVVLPVLAATAVHAVSTGMWPVALVLGTMAVAASVWSFPMSRPVQIWAYIAAAAVGLIVAFLFPPLPSRMAVDTVARAVASAALTITVVTILLRVPLRARFSPLVFALATVVAGGMAKLGLSYFLAVLAFAGAALVAYAWADLPGPRLWGLGRKRVLAVIGGGVLGTGMALSLILLLPPANSRVSNWMMGLIPMPSFSGMSDGVRLQGTTDITLSDEIVLRVHGGGPGRLRGFVLTTYRNGRWSRGAAPQETAIPSAPLAGNLAIQVTPVKSQTRYFFPLGAAQVHVQTGQAIRDGLGQWTAPPGENAGVASFVLAANPGLAIDPPSPADMVLQPELARPLADLASQWTVGSSDPAIRLDKLVERLQGDFTYSLHHSRQTRLDPVLDFLLHRRTGHCEYFASALALLARASGIPSRVVTGYHMQEFNSLGGYHIVRERDAHAWVEAWIAGRGWQTYDATPASYFQSLPSQTPWLRGLFDWLTTPRQASHIRRVLIFGIAAVAILTVLTWLLRRLRPRQAKQPGPRETERPWPALEELLLSLSRRGWQRDRSETLEHFSRRLPTTGDTQAAALIDEYARFRYGGIGQREGLEPRIREASRTLAQAK
jgi:hypothetical protein